MPETYRLRPSMSLDELAARKALADQIADELDRLVRVASGPTYYDGVNDALTLLRGVDPVALKQVNAAKRKERLGW